MTFDGSNAQLSERLRAEKREVEQLGFALGLLVSKQRDVEEMVHRINAWIDDACDALERGS